MSFDIHQDLFPHGEFDEKASERYREALIDRFAASREGQALLDETGTLGDWSDLLIYYGLQYPQVTPATMTASEFHEVVFRIFPRKVSCPPEDAPRIIHELRAFWSFLGREFGLSNAAVCLQSLDESAIPELRRELANPTNFGMAKSFFMAGEAAGFNVHTEEGIAAWTHTYNTQLANIPREPLARPPQALFSLNRPRSARELPHALDPETRSREANRRKRDRRKARRR